MTGKRTRRLGRWAAVPGILALGLLVAGCGEDHPQNIFDAHGPASQQINRLQIPVFILAGIIGVIVITLILVIAVKFRTHRGDETVPRQIHGAPRLEIAWTLAPALLLATITVPTLKVVFDLAAKPPDAMTVDVIGQQWWWEFRYPGILNDEGGPVRTANEMVIPAGTWVSMRISSRDVIHSFWIPALNGKRDAVPGRVQNLKFKADQPGEYWGQCTEFCGLSHANMRQRVVALSADDFAKWVANQKKAGATPTDETAQKGQALFESQCVRCHQIDGLTGPDGKPLISKPDEQLVSGMAPNLTHLMSRTTFAGAAFNLKVPDCVNDTAYTQTYPTGTADNCLNRPDLERWLRNAPAMKPMYPYPSPDSNGLIRGMPALGLTEAQIDQLVAYLMTLK
jgi:cytochrome c oxidase subunit II